MAVVREILTPTQHSRTDDPFGELPGWRTIVHRAVAGEVILIVCLVLIGTAITSMSATAGVRAWDHSVNRWMAADRSDQFVQVAHFFSKIADTLPILGIMALVTIVLATGRHWRALLFIPIAMSIEITTFLAVNYMVRRPRPDVSKIGPIPSTFSFPSGHIAAAFICWLGPALLLTAYGRATIARCVAAVGAVVTVMTGWARVYLGMHHTFDVVFGLAVGAAALVLTVCALNLRFDAEPFDNWRPVGGPESSNADPPAIRSTSMQSRRPS